MGKTKSGRNPPWIFNWGEMLTKSRTDLGALEGPPYRLRMICKGRRRGQWRNQRVL